MPSLADVLFVVLLCATATLLGPFLLSDSDIGWHIRNGGHILATHSVPHTDYFSSTMAGQPWFAWEWLYDLIISTIHSVAGLDGVVLWSGLIFALTMALLFRLTLKTSGNLPISILLTLVSAAASSIHLLARPHLITWLLTLVWFQQLTSFQRDERKQVLVLPVLMALWVNLHGGFLLGLVLLWLFIAANLWTRCTAACIEPRNRAGARLRHLALILALSLGATLLTPYGVRLYAHLYGYLGNTFLMDNISEFLSPNFHLLQVKCFALLLVAAIAGLALGKSRRSAVGLLIIAFAAWSGLYATRNIPFAVILLAPTIAPFLSAAIHGAIEESDLAAWLRAIAQKLDSFSARMSTVELRARGHLLPLLVMIVLLGNLLGLAARKETAQRFDARIMPVQAAEYMAAHDIRGHFFSPDSWGGYLIYRLYPDVRLLVDDRHDFYGEAFMREYLNTLHAGPGWAAWLDAKRANWVVVPPECPLASTLRVSSAWNLVHEDATALIFARRSPLVTGAGDSGALQEPREVSRR